jgi:hypothetical protein
VDALQYYYRALELNPGYIRARSVDFTGTPPFADARE